MYLKEKCTDFSNYYKILTIFPDQVNFYQTQALSNVWDLLFVGLLITGKYRDVVWLTKILGYSYILLQASLREALETKY